ncbi:ABC transporter substrate-binding protein [Finegoldia magna]|uniref:ABC transporter substrate-binding protein n=1 Tax=Finegoldia magna TaxID=1260 RepID=UPI001F5C08D0|nr:extracellular solute-binding protein [Finegoldia magna]
MRKLRKILLMILCGILMLTGCSESAKKAQNENSSGSNVASEDSSKKEKVEIQFWYGLGSVAGQTMESIIADFNASQDKVKVVGVQQADYNETYQKVQAAIAAKQPPAVFIGSKISEMAESQIAVDLSTFMNDKTPESDYLDVLMKPAKINGKIYAIPAYGTTQVMYYRKDLLNKADIKPEDAYSSWEKVYEASKEIQKKRCYKMGTSSNVGC